MKKLNTNKTTAELYKRNTTYRKPLLKPKKVVWAIKKGEVSDPLLHAVVSLTNMRSKKQIRAVQLYFVDGLEIQDIAVMLRTHKGNLKRDIMNVNKAAKKCFMVARELLNATN